MANRFDNNADRTTRKLGEILNRVDQLPVLDNRSPDEIVGYDESGIPASVTPPTSVAPAQDATDSAQDPDMDDWRKTFGKEIPVAVKEFLEYRHREWELGMEADLKARQEKQTERTRKL
jgi:uncharacterized protein HemX